MADASLPVEEDPFNLDDLSLKKKKKKKVPKFDGEADPVASGTVPAGAGGAPDGDAVPAAAAAADLPAKKDDAADMDFTLDLTMKKKKKKNAAVEGELLPGLEVLASKAASTAAETPVLSADAPVAALPGAPAAAAPIEDEDLDLTLSSKKKKKKKGAKTIADLDDIIMAGDTDGAALGAAADAAQAVAMEEAREYSYAELLERVFEIMRQKNPDMVAGEKRRFVMKPPQVVRIGTKKCAFVNYAEICKLLHRQPDHVMGFLLAELGTSGSVDGSSALVLKGRFQQKQIETVLRHYIREYVTCHTCKAPDTILAKENRLFFLQCEKCGSKCSVASIKTGFQAVTGKRSALRAKTDA